MMRNGKKVKGAIAMNSPPGETTPQEEVAPS